jgi:hypothetical protein
MTEFVKVAKTGDIPKPTPLLHNHIAEPPKPQSQKPRITEPRTTNRPANRVPTLM